MQESYKPRVDAFREEDDNLEKYSQHPAHLTVIEGGKSASDEVPDYSTIKSESLPITPASEVSINAPEAAPAITNPDSTLEVSIPANSNEAAKETPFTLPRASEQNSGPNMLESIQLFGTRASVAFEQLSANGKRFASSLYEGLYATPGLNRLVGKMEIAYNQFFIDRHEKAALTQKTKAAELDSKVAALEKTAGEIETTMTRLEALGAPGLDSLKRKALDLDKEKLGLLLKKEEVKNRIDARAAKIETFSKERDLIADRMIATYNEKLAPIEGHLSSLEGNRHMAEAQAETMKEEHALQLKELDALEQQKNELETVLRSTGMSEGQITRFGTIKQIEQKLKQSRESIRTQEEEMSRTLIELQKKIDRATERTAPFKVRKKEFEQLKQKGLSRAELGARSTEELAARRETAPTPERSSDVSLERSAFFERSLTPPLKILEEFILKGAEGDPDLAEETIDALTELCDQDPALSEFLTKLFQGDYSPAEQAQWIGAFFEEGRPYLGHDNVLEERPAIIALPNSDSMLQVRIQEGVVSASIVTQ